jgi:microcystin-dependent protein
MKKQILLSIFGATMLSATMNAQGQDPFLGQIAFVGFNFAPVGWAECNGQLLPIAQNAALFSLLGTQYGGNGTTNFALPDMRGRVVVHSGQGPQLSNYNQGQIGGTESVTLTQGEMPTHTHLVNAVTAEGNDASPTGNLPANTKTLDKEYSTAVANTTMKSTMLNPTGGSLPHENRPPYLALKCIIALQGIFPSRP